MNHTKGTPGSRRNKKPERMCVVCRERKEKQDLVRIVLTGEGYFLDPKGAVSGRGTYVCASEECIRRGYTKKIFEKALGRKMPEDFFEELLSKGTANG